MRTLLLPHAEVVRRLDALSAVLGTSDGTLRLLKMLRLVRSLRQIRVLEPRPARAEEVAGRAYRELSLPVRVSPSVEEAVADAEVVLVTAGAPGAAPLETVPGGCHVAVVDPALRDAVPAELLSASLRGRARVVVDDRSIAREAGWTDGEIDAELGTGARGAAGADGDGGHGARDGGASVPGAARGVAGVRLLAGGAGAAPVWS